jgi:hypothetical protein
MAQGYALGDRRCRTQTALDKLAQLRRRVQRFTSLGDTLKKLFAPTLDKALTFLDDKLLPSTSHAVERGNRRERKRQKQVYRVRTQVQIRHAWHWIGGVQPTPKAGNKPSPHSLVHGLDKPGVFTTVSLNLDLGTL